MAAKKTLLAIVIAVLAIVLFFSWTAWRDGHLGWPHVVGLAASVLLLVVIWFWPGTRQPTEPPP